MGICQYCYEETKTQELKTLKTLNLKAGPQFNAINFTFTNRPLTELKGDCLIFYADHVKELSQISSLEGVSRKTKRKIFEYLTFAEQQSESTHMKHFLVPISIPGLKFTHLMFVKIEPWDGGSKFKIEKRIYNLTKGYLESFKMRNMKEFTILEFDQLSGIHHSLSFLPLAKAIEEYASDIKSVNIVCNSVDSIEYYYQKIRYWKPVEKDFNRSKKDRNDERKERKKSQKEDNILFG